MMRYRVIWAAIATLLFSPAGAFADVAQNTYGVSIQTDVVYGQGLVGVSSPTPKKRDLKLDVYRPTTAGKPLEGRPAVVMVFGGAYHRGDRGTKLFEEDGASDSSMSDYCQMFASAGYVCLSIDYRLVPEDPALPANLNTASLFPKAALMDPRGSDRIEFVRRQMGLSPLDDRSREQLWNTMFAATEDLTSAVAYARANAKKLGLDPNRIAIGGFSSGAITAISAVYGAGLPVNAVISLSGGPGVYDIRKTLKGDMPPGLFIVGQNDLFAIQATTKPMLDVLNAAGIKTEAAWMPGYGHFYPMGAVSLSNDMTKQTLRTRILRFLDSNLGGSR